MFKPDRIMAFSDGVMAIAITLLVLGLEVPSVHDVPERELHQYLSESFHSLLGYVTSFVLIGTYWMQHYAIFHFIKHANRVFILLNNLFLMCVSFLPFPTGLQAAYRDDERAIVIYAGAHFLCGVSLLALWIYATNRRRLVAADLAPRIVTSMTWRIACTPLISIAAIGLSLISITLSRVLFLTIPVLHFSHRNVDEGWNNE